MTIVTAPLLREWSMLRDHVVPSLLEVERRDGEARVWAVGELADAVAVAAAYQQASASNAGHLTTFTTGQPAVPTFSLSDIRCMPRSSRSAFRRSERGWVPAPEVAERIFLCEPRRQVDLVTLRNQTWDPVALDRSDRMLRPGGLLMLADQEIPGLDRPDLRPVDRAGRLFQKDPAAPEGAPSAPPEHQDPVETLANRQIQSELVTSHANLARSLARRFSGHGESRQDLDQVALLALVKAAGRYETERNISFSTFATATILGELKRHFRDKTWMMRVPRSVQENYLAIKDAREALSHELSCSPTIQQIAERLSISDEMVLEAMEAGENYWPESLDVGIHEGESGRDVPVIDSSFDLVVEQQDLKSLLPRLAPRERVLLKRLYFDGWTQRQVAEEIGVSQMHISRLLNKTIEKLRIWASDDRFSCAG